MFRKILAALDHSDSSKQVFEEALALAQATHAQLMLLHVLDSTEEGYPTISTFPRMDGIYPALYEEAMQRYAQEWQAFEQRGFQVLTSLANEANEAGVETDISQVLGKAGSEICAIARSWQADLILVGRRRRTELGELLLGSVSHYITHHAPCAVLVLQTPQKPNPVKALEHATTH